MSPVQKAIADVKFKIPAEILSETFIRTEFGGRTMLPVTVDAMIREKIVDARVAMDVNLTGGTEVLVPLDGVPTENIDLYNIVYRIPKSLTEGKRISRVVSLGLGGGIGLVAANVGNSGGVSEVWNTGMQVLNAASNIPQISTARCRLIGENTVLITEANAMFANAYLRCYVEHDTDFSQLRSTTYPAFSKLVELATKAYVYNTLIIRMGESKISSGFELGRFREIVDGYADANELYDTYMEETWRRVAIMDDQRSHERHISMLIGGPR